MPLTSAFANGEFTGLDSKVSLSLKEDGGWLEDSKNSLQVRSIARTRNEHIAWDVCDQPILLFIFFILIVRRHGQLLVGAPSFKSFLLCLECQFWEISPDGMKV